MLRPKWFGNGDAGSQVEISTADFARAPFVLMVEYLRPNGSYGIKAKIRLRDAGVLGLIESHRLRDLVIVIDRGREAADKQQAALTADMQARLEAEGPVYVLSPWQWAWTLSQKAAVLLEQHRTLKVTFGRLLDHGIEVRGSMTELRGLVWDLSKKVDEISGLLETGQSFDQGLVVVYAPGSKGKPDKPKPLKPDTAPSEWGT